MQARLTQQLVCENGSHRPATWDEAMDRVVAAFSKSIKRNDPRNFGMFSCSKTTNELNYAAQKFVRSVSLSCGLLHFRLVNEPVTPGATVPREN